MLIRSPCFAFGKTVKLICQFTLYSKVSQGLGYFFLKGKDNETMLVD